MKPLRKSEIAQPGFMADSNAKRPKMRNGAFRRAKDFGNLRALGEAPESAHAIAAVRNPGRTRQEIRKTVAEVGKRRDARKKQVFT